MVKWINKIPAGMFLVPLIISMIFNAFMPNLFMTGGFVQNLFSGEGVGFILAAMTFFSGVGLKLSNVAKIVKRHGILLLIKAAITIGLSLLYMNFFGQDGIFGINALAFTVAVGSINPAVYMSVVKEYGEEMDTAAFGLTGMFSIPIFPIIIYSMAMGGSTGGGMDWTPVITTLIPLIAGMVLGNLDDNFAPIFTPGIGIMLPLLGWNLGQTLDLFASIKAGGSGILLTVIFMVLNIYLFLVDRYVLKNDGIVGIAMTNVAGVSTSTPAIIAAMFAATISTEMASAAVSQVLLAVIITSFISPFWASIQKRKVYGE